jgi:hypothetical protein
VRVPVFDHPPAIVPSELVLLGRALAGRRPDIGLMWEVPRKVVHDASSYALHASLGRNATRCYREVASSRFRVVDEQRDERLTIESVEDAFETVVLVLDRPPLLLDDPPGGTPFDFLLLAERLVTLEPRTVVLWRRAPAHPWAAVLVACGRGTQVDIHVSLERGELGIGNHSGATQAFRAPEPDAAARCALRLLTHLGPLWP